MHTEDRTFINMAQSKWIAFDCDIHEIITIYAHEMSNNEEPTNYMQCLFEENPTNSSFQYRMFFFLYSKQQKDCRSISLARSQLLVFLGARILIIITTSLYCNVIHIGAVNFVYKYLQCDRVRSFDRPFKT